MASPLQKQNEGESPIKTPIPRPAVSGLLYEHESVSTVVALTPSHLKETVQLAERYTSPSHVIGRHVSSTMRESTPSPNMGYIQLLDDLPSDEYFATPASMMREEALESGRVSSPAMEMRTSSENASIDAVRVSHPKLLNTVNDDYQDPEIHALIHSIFTLSSYSPLSVASSLGALSGSGKSPISTSPSNPKTGSKAAVATTLLSSSTLKKKKDEPPLIPISKWSKTFAETEFYYSKLSQLHKECDDALSSIQEKHEPMTSGVAVTTPSPSPRLGRHKRSSSAMTASSRDSRTPFLTAVRSSSLLLERRYQQLQVLLASVEARPIIDWDPKELAQQLTLLDFMIFRWIRKEELESKAWMRTQSNDERRLVAPGICAHTDFFNYVACWVQHSILNDICKAFIHASLTEKERERERGRIILHFIKVGGHLASLCSFNMLKAVTSGLSTALILRLKKSWSTIPRKVIMSFSALKASVSESKNFGYLRRTLKKKPAPAIPFLGLYLHDLVYADAASSSALRQRATFENCLGTVLNDIAYFQKTPYDPLVLHQSTCHYLLSRPWFSEDELYAKSFEIEPSSRK